ncbi:MAG: PPOX class F420-dependent oxidoreductase [Nocardioidaceae bacterium]
MTSLDGRLVDLLRGQRLGRLVTIKRDGRAQLSNVNYTYDDTTQTIRVSVTADRAKTHNLRRDPRASFHVESDDGWSYVVAEGTAELTPVATEPSDATVEELVDVYRAISGEHPDWDEYRTVMVQDRRLVLRLPVDRVYGLAR